MPIRKICFWTRDSDRDRRLDELVSERLAESLGRPLSRAKVRRLLVAGAVTVNGTVVRIASLCLGAPARVEARVDLARLDADTATRDRSFAMDKERVLFEDAVLLVVDKPPGLPTHPTVDPSRESLVTAVQRFLREREGLSPSAPAPYLGVHQRLDRDTSGVLLFVKDRAMNAAVGRLFAERRALKTYQALTVRPAALPPRRWDVRDFLGPAPRERGRGKRTRYRSVRSGGAPAHTELRLLEALRGGLHVEARPHTGRTHQIRVHLAEAGLAILGDDLYGPAQGTRPVTGSDAGAPPRLMLHAASLAFPHPATGELLCIESPLPPDFRDCLARLGKKKGPRAR